MLAPDTAEGGLKPFSEGLRSEPFRPLTQNRWIKLTPQPSLFEPAESLNQRRHRLIREQHPCGLLNAGCRTTHRVQKSTTAETDHRSSRRHCLHRCDPEILNSRIDVRPTARQQQFHLLL